MTDTGTETRNPIVHELKTVQPYFDLVASGEKNFDMREADRDFRAGDFLKLQEYVERPDDVDLPGLSGREVLRRVTYVMDDPKHVLPGTVVLGMADLKPGDVLPDDVDEAPCVFCEVVAGRAPSVVLQQWTDAIAIKPLTPVTDGHILIIPRRHVADFAESPHVSGSMMCHAAEYASANPAYAAANVISSRGRAATQSIDHLHVHVVPRTETDKLMLPWGTMFGEDPTAPHWCRVAQGLQDQLDQRPAAVTCPAVLQSDGIPDEPCALDEGHAPVGPGALRHATRTGTVFYLPTEAGA